ncbi:hypothetical protein ACFZCP_44990 [Streptomyces sp. NPDC007971]|uniref:hypothetical protein n=1 Tax=Streptomyces sp. NPDC007971 TaxID=3364799 RepID=UPI0036ECA9CF
MTQALQKKAERERRAAEDLRRWHSERFRVAKELFYRVKETERILWAACASLPSDEECARFREAGHTTIFSVREADVPPDAGDPLIFNAGHLETIKEALLQAHELLEEAEQLTAEISILTEGATPDAATVMFEATWEAAGALETTRGSRDAAVRAVLTMKEPIAAFQASVREELGVTTPP